MHPHPDRFPNGMKVVSDYIHSLGLKAGIYSDAGDNTCGSIYDNDANGVGSGLYGHEQQDMDYILKNGTMIYQDRLLWWTRTGAG